MRNCRLIFCSTAAAAGGGGGGGNGGRTVGYGPFSTTAKARLARERHEQQQQTSAAAAASAATVGGGGGGQCSARPVDVMQNIQLGTNLNLRLSLAALPHPSQLKGTQYRSPEWRRSMTQLYRTVLRLHNNAVAVSVSTARMAGAAEAVSSVTGVGGGRMLSAEETFLTSGNGSNSNPSDASIGDCAAAAAANDPTSPDDYLLRYLLTPEQREFGNRFVQGEFRRHLDADAVYAQHFYDAWYQYVLQLASGVTSREMTAEEKRMLSPEQKEKLDELRGGFTSIKIQKQPGFML